MATIDAVEVVPGSNELKRNALGLPSAMGMSLAFISPTIGVLFISALVASKAGVSSPFVFIFGTIGITLMASTLAQFTKRVTSAGTFYKFITLAFGPKAGLVAGMLLMFAYALQSPLNTNLFGGYVSDALRNDFGISIPWWVLMIGLVVAVGALAWYSVHVSMQFGIAFLIAEVTVVAILLVYIVVTGGDSGQAPQAFTPSHSTNGFGGMGQAFVFIVLTFFGFESCSTVAEEVRNPRKNLPIALIGSVLLTGLWFTLAVYSIIVGYGAKHIDQLAGATAPMRDLAERYIGGWYANIVDLAAVSALIAVVLAIHTANFRIMYALGRDGLLHRACGRTHSRHQTPHIAIIVYSIATLGIGLAAGIGWGPIAAFGNLGYLSSLGILPIFILTNVALPTFMLKRYRDEFSVLVHLVFPTLSSLTFIAAIYLNLHPWPKSPLNVMPWIILAVIAAAIVWVSVMGRGGSDTLDRLGNVLFMAPTAEDAAASARSEVTSVPVQTRPGLGGAGAPL